MKSYTQEHSHTEIFFPSLLNLQPSAETYQPNPTKKSMVDRLASKVQLKTVYLASRFMLAYCAILAIIHPFFLEGKTAVIMTSIAVGTSFLGGGVALLIKKRKVNALHAENLFLLISGPVMINVYSHAYLTQEPIQLALAVFLPCLFGVVCLKWIHFYCLSGISLSLFLFFAFTFPPDYLPHFAFLFLIGVVLGLLSYVPRANLLFFNLNALIENRDQLRNLKKQKTDLSKLYDQALVATTAKERFLQSVSHELRTPLNAIAGYTHLLDSVETPLNETQKTRAQYINDASQLLLGLVDDILQFTNSNEYEPEINIELIAPISIVKTTVALITREADNKEIKIEILPSAYSTLPQVYGDRDRCRQVLLNLLSNAVNYSGRHGSISIGCQQLEDGFIRMVVADTGPGIAEEDQTRLFTAFDRLDKVHSDIRGLGLGLKTAKAMVEQMGGRIGFQSKKEEGSVFWFDLLDETSMQQKKAS